MDKIKKSTIVILLFCMGFILFGCAQRIPVTIKLGHPPSDIPKFSEKRKIGPAIELFVKSFGALPGTPNVSSIPGVYELKSLAPDDTYSFPVGHSLEKALDDMLHQLYDQVVHGDFAPIKIEVMIDSFRLYYTGINQNATCNLIVNIKVTNSSGRLIVTQRFETSKTSMFDGVTQPAAIWEATYDIAKQIERTFISSKKIARSSIDSTEINYSSKKTYEGNKGNNQRKNIKRREESINFSVDIEQNIPKYKRKNKNGVAFLIGNQKYKDLPNVDYAERDVDLMSKYLEKVMGFKPDNIVVYKNATSGELRSIFGSRENPKGKLHNFITKNKSDVFIYYVGHGGPGADGKTSYLVPVDATIDYIQNNGYPLDLFFSIVKKLPSKKTTVVLDSCFSGNSASGALFKNISPALIRTADPIKKLAKTTIFYASTKDQVATWYPDKKHSLFSYFFLKSLQGAADSNNDKKIKVGEIEKYLKENVKKRALRLSNRTQTPIVTGDRDVVIAEFE